MSSAEIESRRVWHFVEDDKHRLAIQTVLSRSGYVAQALSLGPPAAAAGAPVLVQASCLVEHPAAPRLRAWLQGPDVVWILLGGAAGSEVVAFAVAARAQAALNWPPDADALLATLALCALRAEAAATARRSELELQRALASSRRISAAVGMLAEREHIGVDQAFDRLRSAARSDRRTLHEVAQELIQRRGEAPVLSSEPVLGAEDRHELLRAADALLRRDQQLTAIVETALDAIVTADHALRVVVFNPAAERLFGYRRDEAIGMPLSNLLPLRARERHDDLVRHFGATGYSARPMGKARELRALRKDGSELEIEASIARSGDGANTLYTAVLRDLSERRRLAAAESRRQAAEAANEAKSHFLSRTSHELRTPLNAILGFVQLMRTDARHPPPPAQAERLDLIASASRNLLGVVDDLLDLARIESGTLRLRREPLDLLRVVREAAALAETLARERNIRITLRADDETAWWVSGDARACWQVVMNLLGNAIKFNRQGGAVDLWLNSMGEQRELRVTDTGRGMTPEQCERIFAPFARVGDTSTPGLGLGLAISRDLVRAMHGTLRVASGPDVGTTFTLGLPAAGPPEPPPVVVVPLVKTEPQRPQRQLVYIEDDAVSSILMVHVVNQVSGWQIETFDQAADGLAAIERLEPTLVLTDLSLPDLSGVELIRRVRALPGGGARVVVAVSADATAAAEHAALAAGADAFWTKPLDLPRVMSWLEGG